MQVSEQSTPLRADDALELAAPHHRRHLARRIKQRIAGARQRRIGRAHRGDLRADPCRTGPLRSRRRLPDAWITRTAAMPLPAGPALATHFARASALLRQRPMAGSSSGSERAQSSGGFFAKSATGADLDVVAREHRAAAGQRFAGLERQQRAPRQRRPHRPSSSGRLPRAARRQAFPSADGSSRRATRSPPASGT